MLTVEQIKKALQDANLAKVSKNSGIGPGAIYRFMNEKCEPKYATVKALSDYLEGRANNDKS